jgi:hypothetical protein
MTFDGSARGVRCAQAIGVSSRSGSAEAQGTRERKSHAGQRRQADIDGEEAPVLPLYLRSGRGSQVRTTAKRRTATALVSVLAAALLQLGSPPVAWAASCTPNAPKPFLSSGDVIGRGTIKCDRTATFQWKLAVQKKVSGSWVTIDSKQGTESVPANTTFGTALNVGNCDHNETYRDEMSINNGARTDRSNPIVLC